MMDCKNFITSTLLYIGPMVSHYFFNSSNNKPIYLLRITIIYLYVQVEKIARGKLEAYEACSGYRRGIIPLHILFPLFGIPLLIYSHYSSQVICEILKHPLWYSDPLYHYNISVYNCD